MSNKVNFKNAKSHYETLHDYYTSFYGNTLQAHRPADIEELHVYLNKQIGFVEGDKVLDAGCGVCGPAVFFAQHNDIEIDAITNSEKQIETADILIKKNRLEDVIRLHSNDYHNIATLFQREYFDKIIFLESFGHSDNKKNLLISSYNILKFDGVLYIKDYFATEITGSLKRQILMKKARMNLKKQYCYYLANLYETLKICRKLGFAIDFIKKPDFKLYNEDVVNAFEKELQIDLFGNSYMPIIVEPLEIKLIKVKRDVGIY